MAVVIPKYNRIVQDQPQQAFYMVSIDTSGFLDTESNNGGRISPCVAEDFATAPTTLAQSRLINRGALRFKKMLELLQVRSNVSVRNILTTYASDAGDNPITDLNFTLVFDTADFVPTTGTTIDGSTSTTTKALYIQDKIAEALNTTRTEKMSVFNPTSGAGSVADIEVTAGPVLTASIGEIVEGITVAEVTTFRPNTANQTPTDNALSYTAE